MRKCWLGLLLLSSVCFAQIRAEPELLKRATRVTELPADQWPWVARCIWLSDHEIYLLRDRASHTELRDPDWQAFRRDLRTDTDTPLSKFDILLKSLPQDHGTDLSSDGKWALWEAWFSFVAMEAARLDGSVKEIVAWPQTFYDYDNKKRFNMTYWIGNSHAWVEFPALPTNHYRIRYAIIHNVDHPRFHRRIWIGSSSPLKYGVNLYNAKVVSLHQMLVIHPNQARNLDILYVTDLAAGGRSKQQYVLRAEPGAYLGEVVFSHRGDQVAWFSYRWEGDRQISHVWVSNLNGTGKQSLGKLEASNIRYLQWLPDDKHLSFLCQDALWTVPAE